MMRVRAQQWSLVIAACVLASWVSAAHAHEAELRQQLLLQVGAEDVEALLLFEIGAGEEAALLRASFDQNRDAQLDEDERRALAGQLAQDAVSGLALTRDDASLESTGLDWRLELGPGTDGSILLALMMRFEGGGGAGRYAASLEGEPGSARPPIRFEAEAGVGLVVSAGVSAPEPDGIATGALVLSPGDALWFEIASE